MGRIFSEPLSRGIVMSSSWFYPCSIRGSIRNFLSFTIFKQTAAGARRGPGEIVDDGTTRQPARPASPGLDRRVSRPGDVPDDGRGAPPLCRRPGAPGEPILGDPVPSSGARRVGGLLAARPDPAVVLLPGGRRAAVLPRRPGRPGAVAGEADRARNLEGARPRPARDLPPVGRAEADELHLRGHAHADRARVRLPVPARAAPGPGPVA